MVHLTRHSATRGLGALLVIVVAALVPVSLAWADANIAVDPSSASPGQSVTISGNVPTDGCDASDAAQLVSTADLFPPDGFGPPATRAPTGDFSTSYAIPAATPLGDYSIGVRCGGGNVGISTTLHVVAAPVATTTTTTTTTTPSTTTSTSTTTATTVTSTTTASSSASSSSSSSSALPWILLGLAAVVAALLAVYFVRTRRRA